MNWGLSRLWKDGKKGQKKGQHVQNCRVKMGQELGQAQGYVEMDENHGLREAQWGTGKGKGNNTNPCNTYSFSFGWNHTEENTEIGLKNWDCNPDLIDSKTKAGLYYRQPVVP